MDRLKLLAAKPAYRTAQVVVFAIAAVDLWFLAADRMPEMRGAIEIFRWFALAGFVFSLWMLTRAVAKRHDVSEDRQRHG